MSTAAIEERLTSLWETPKTIYGWFATVDHKTLGIRYVVTAVVLMLIGGIEALLMRIQLSRLNLDVLSPAAYNQIFTMGGTTMIFWYAPPILSGFADLSNWSAQTMIVLPGTGIEDYSIGDKDGQ